MYRITGDPIWQEKGWRMFESVIAATSVPNGHSAIDDVSSNKAATFVDNMESFWLAETLKYFYLLFAPPETISLDEWVFNTEAHPFRRPT
jgi:mannosyl-oligosaccharide alpha-1,2-mannosidase